MAYNQVGTNVNTGNELLPSAAGYIIPPKFRGMTDLNGNVNQAFRTQAQMLPNDSSQWGALKANQLGTQAGFASEAANRGMLGSMNQATSQGGRGMMAQNLMKAGAQGQGSIWNNLGSQLANTQYEAGKRGLETGITNAGAMDTATKANLGVGLTDIGNYNDYLQALVEELRKQQIGRELSAAR